MIKSFKTKETEDLYNSKFDKKYPEEIAKRVKEKLDELNSITDIKELEEPNSNHLEKLSGDESSFYSIRVNQKWRIIFKWDEEEKNCSEVEFIDYHK